MQKNIPNKSSQKVLSDKKASKPKEEDDIQLNLISKPEKTVESDSSEESDDEEQNSNKFKADNLGTYNENENQDIFDSNNTFKSIGVNKNFYPIIYATKAFLIFYICKFFCI